ncbi:cytospin-B-like [Meleagris gallopavo]|uniref:cytospin-B-like n=1 Tax=Meleagris gallopavo TaxID=9103 RepID=UPI00093EBE34|nr:cytospin-B-like [Meleagris gallopavo]
MKSTARPWSAVSKPGSHGVDRGKSLSTASSGMKTSKSSTSLAFESRLSKLKRACSDDMLTKPGVTAASGVSRLKKTITTGAISELAESRLKPGTEKLSICPWDTAEMQEQRTSATIFVCRLSS